MQAALDLLVAGNTYEEVAQKLGYAGRQSIHEAIKNYLQSIKEPTVHEWRRIENARLEKALKAIWPRVERGDDAAIHLLIRISDRRSKLLGMDLQPMLVVAPNGNGLEPNGHDAERTALAERIAALTPDAKERLAATCRELGILGPGSPGTLP